MDVDGKAGICTMLICAVMLAAASVLAFFVAIYLEHDQEFMPFMLLGLALLWSILSVLALHAGFGARRARAHMDSYVVKEVVNRLLNRIEENEKGDERQSERRELIDRVSNLAANALSDRDRGR